MAETKAVPRHPKRPGSKSKGALLLSLRRRCPRDHRRPDRDRSGHFKSRSAGMYGSYRGQRAVWLAGKLLGNHRNTDDDAIRYAGRGQKQNAGNEREGRERRRSCSGTVERCVEAFVRACKERS